MPNNDDLKRGIVPGIIAGYIFLAYTGSAMQADIGNMINSDMFVGFILHIVISVVVGAIYTGVFLAYVDLGNPLVNIVVGGLIYGLIWWIIVGNIIVPVVTGGDAQVLSLTIDENFYGHIVFGHALAFLVVLRDAAMGMGDKDE